MVKLIAVNVPLFNDKWIDLGLNEYFVQSLPDDLGSSYADAVCIDLVPILYNLVHKFGVGCKRLAVGQNSLWNSSQFV